MIRLGRFTFACAITAAACSAANGATLFTTLEDFTGWSGNGAAASAVGDTDASTINGLGNTTAPGGAGAAGALSITIASTFGQSSSPGQQGNAPFIALMRTLAETDAPTVSLDYVPPANITSYWEPQLFFNYDGHWGGISPVSTVNNGTHFTASYNLNSLTIPVVLSYFQIGLTSNNGADEVGKSFTLDNISAVPEPAAIGFVSLIGLAGLRRRRAGQE